MYFYIRSEEEKTPLMSSAPPVPPEVRSALTVVVPTEVVRVSAPLSVVTAASIREAPAAVMVTASPCAGWLGQCGYRPSLDGEFVEVLYVVCSTLTKSM